MKDVERFMILIARYLQGDITNNDKERLFHWIRENPDHQKVYDQMQKTWNISATDVDYEPDVEAGWQKFNQLIDQNQENDKSKEENSGQISVWKKIYRLAAAFILLAVFTWFIVNLVKEDEIVMQTADRETKEVILPDSSRVWLNENSLLTYSQNFEKRNVELQGEAFFEVQNEKGKRFTVLSPKGKIEVIGTSFNVKDYPDEEVYVHVVEGRVAFSPRQEEDYVYLTEGEFATLEVKNVVLENLFDNENFQSWRNHQLTFQATDMNRLINDLEKYFHIDFEVTNPDILDCQFTGSFSDPTLQEVLEVLQASMDLIINQKEDLIILSGKGC